MFQNLEPAEDTVYYFVTCWITAHYVGSTTNVESFSTGLGLLGHSASSVGGRWMSSLKQPSCAACYETVDHYQNLSLFIVLPASVQSSQLNAACRVCIIWAHAHFVMEVFLTSLGI